MRWLLEKDLLVLRRSPLLVAVLVLYPVVLALLIGLALSRGPEQPKVAIVNELPEGETLRIGGESFDLFGARRQLFERVDPVEASTRKEAIDKVKSGEALAAIVIPRDTVQKLQGQLQRPTIEVYVNQEDPLKARLVDDTITSVLTQANRRVSRAFTRVNLGYLDLVLNGGHVSVFGQRFNVLGLENVERIARRARDRLPPGSSLRESLDRVVRFTSLARQNLDLTDDILAAVSEPIVAKKIVLEGSSVPLTTFAASVAVALSLMFVAVLLAAGALALERSENVFERLVRGPLSRRALLAEKMVLAAVCAVVVTLLLLLGLGIFIPLEWGRFPLWVVGLIAAASAFAAMGTAIGAVAREVSTASLMAFALLVPLAFLALVPSGLVSEGLYDLSRAVSALFPVRPTIDAMRAALYGDGSVIGPLLHLLALTVAFGVAARAALARFATV